MSHVKVAVFPVAGLGTRFLPATKSIPKELLPLVDRPLIDHAIDEARAAGIEEFIFVTSPDKPALRRHLSALPDLEQLLSSKGKTTQLAAVRRSSLPTGSAHFLYQEAPLGLGHAVGLAAEAVGDRPFAVVLVDDVIRAAQPCMAQMVAAHARTGGHMVATMEVPTAQVSSYGILDVSSDSGRIAHARGLVEKPAVAEAPSRLAIVGRYILQPSIFGRLARTGPGAGGEIQLTDAINADAGVMPITGYRFEGTRFDCGSVAGHLEATLAYACDRPELRECLGRALAAGATGLQAAA